MSLKLFGFQDEVGDICYYADKNIISFYKFLIHVHAKQILENSKYNKQQAHSIARNYIVRNPYTCIYWYDDNDTVYVLDEDYEVKETQAKELLKDAKIGQCIASW